MKQICQALALALLTSSCTDMKQSGAMETNQLKITLQITRQGEDLYAHLRFANTGEHPFPLEYSLSGQSAPARRQFFEVTKEMGEEIPYIGQTVKRRAAEYPGDYVTIQPGTELAAAYPFEKEYGFDAGHNTYSIRYEAVNSLPGSKGLVFLKSNMVTFDRQ